MAEDLLRILQASTGDLSGGAATVAWNLFQAYRRRGHTSRLAVGSKHSSDPDVLLLTDHPRPGAAGASPSPAAPAVLLERGRKALGFGRAVVRRAGRFVDLFEDYWGFEDFRYAATWDLLGLIDPRPHVLHCHNLHGGYFDLRALPWLSHQVPVVLTLHDAWLLSGHCAHSFDCERWTTGCGRCPDLSIYPAIRRDATAYNWRRKQRLYEASRLHIATPSRWLMNKVERSMLGPARVEARVIPNGVDLTVFRPAPKREVRARLQMPCDAKVILFAANGIRQNVWKDYQTLRAAVGLASAGMRGTDLRFIALGEAAPPEQLDGALIEFVPYQAPPEAVARYYQAADIYVHAARADTFPTTILEALACGTPVVATEVGGIPEQIRPLEGMSCRTAGERGYGVSQATGVLVAQGDARAMAVSLEELLRNQALRCHLGQNARRDAEQRFDLERQVDEYLEWYQELMEKRAR